MATRFQHLFLAFSASALASISQPLLADEKTKLRADNELFDIGLIAGVLTVEDFPSEFVVGANITFKASEDFFIQYNYITADVSTSFFEDNPGSRPFALDERQFDHYDLVLGYNIFQGEYFATENSTHLSSMYVVAGIGDTDFGGEKNFTYTLGLGYQVEFFRKILVRFDYRDYIFDSSLIPGEREDTLHNHQFSLGVGYLF